MKNKVIRYANKILMITLIFAILANGGLAVYQTHIYCTVSFGTAPAPNLEAQVHSQVMEKLAVALPVATLTPIPSHKPKVQ